MPSMNYVPIDEQPERVPENIPDDILQTVVDYAASYGECPCCETQQWHPVLAGHNSSHDCVECGETLSIIG